MEFTEEIEDLKKFYKSRVEESEESLDQDFRDGIDMLEDWIKDYRRHVKYCESYNNLIHKVQNENIKKSTENLRSFLKGLNVEEESDE